MSTRILGMLVQKDPRDEAGRPEEGNAYDSKAGPRAGAGEAGFPGTAARSARPAAALAVLDQPR